MWGTVVDVSFSMYSPHHIWVQLDESCRVAICRWKGFQLGQRVKVESDGPYNWVEECE